MLAQEQEAFINYLRKHLSIKRFFCSEMFINELILSRHYKAGFSSIKKECRAFFNWGTLKLFLSAYCNNFKNSSDFFRFIASRFFQTKTALKYETCSIDKIEKICLSGRYLFSNIHLFSFAHALNSKIIKTVMQRISLQQHAV